MKNVLEHKIIVQLQIRLEVALFSNLEYFSIVI